MLDDSLKFLDTQVIEKTYLGESELSVKEENFPKFVRQEIIVNAVTHRAYSILGTDIQIKMSDDKLIVESPGKLPGQVSINNIRHTHFSRNPKIAEYLKIYNYVKEYCEGVDRMINELEELNFPPLSYEEKSYILKVILNTKPLNENTYSSLIFIKEKINNQKNKTQKNILILFDAFNFNIEFNYKDVMDVLNCSSSTLGELIRKLLNLKIIMRIKKENINL